MQIEEYRPRLEQFHYNLNQELYRHYSGLKEKVETSSVYSDYSDLFSLDTIREIRSEIDSLGSDSSRKKTLVKLHAFAVDRHLEHSCQHLSQQIADREAKSSIFWGDRVHLPDSGSTLPGQRTRRPSRRRLNELRAEVDRRLQFIAPGTSRDSASRGSGSGIPALCRSL